MGRPPTPLAARFAQYFVRGEPIECWLWTGCIDTYGYGRVFAFGKHKIASRIAWLLEHDDPGELMVCHSCDNRACVNPAHLFLGTHADNMRDMMAKGRVGMRGRSRRGETHHKAKLTEAQALRVKFGNEPTFELAREFGVEPSTVGQIRRGKSWVWLKCELTA